MTYIESNLDSKLDIDTLSKIANLSKFHFHRQCKAAWGSNIHHVIKLLRMKRAAYLLAYRNDHSIMTIALMSGFESHEAFSRNFKSFFGISPRSFRQAPDWSHWQKQYEPITQLRNQIMNEPKQAEVTIVLFPSLEIATIEHRGAPNQLGNTIRTFIDWRKANNAPPSKERTFNFLYDNPNEVAAEDYRFDIGCSFNKEILPNDQNVFKKVIKPGRCALIRHIGSDDCIDQKVEYLYSQWLKESGQTLRDFPLFFERVSFFPDVAENEMVTDVYLPIN